MLYHPCCIIHVVSSHNKMFQGLVELLKELKELEIGVEEIRLNIHFLIRESVLVLILFTLHSFKQSLSFFLKGFQA